MTILVVCIHVIVCLVLIVVILLQAGRGQGLTGASFGGNVQSLFGTKASSFLTKATTISAILFLFTCIGLNIMDIQKSRSLFKTPSNQAPLDVDQIKKALEKIKTDGNVTVKTTPGGPTVEVKTTETASKSTTKTTQPATNVTPTKTAETTSETVAQSAQAATNTVEADVTSATKASTSQN